MKDYHINLQYLIGYQRLENEELEEKNWTLEEGSKWWGVIDHHPQCTTPWAQILKAKISKKELINLTESIHFTKKRDWNSFSLLDGSPLDNCDNNVLMQIMMFLNCRVCI
jgi:hypothetical protein